MMKYSEITVKEAISFLADFCPVKIILNDKIIFNDEDDDPVQNYPGWQEIIITFIEIEIVHFHHSIITLKGV